MGEPTLAAFRRWIQHEINELESIPSSSDRDKRLLHLESALQEAIVFETAWNLRIEAEVEPVVETSNVRLVSPPIESSPQNATEMNTCNHCDSELNDDLKFCPSCGEFQ
jgi:rRNA maturation endonuclease Nob1